MKLRVLSPAEAEATEAACWYDDQAIGLGELFLSEYAAALLAIEVDPLRFGLLEATIGCRCATVGQRRA